MVALAASAASLSDGMVALMSKGANAALRVALRASWAITFALVMSTVIMFYAPILCILTRVYTEFWPDTFEFIPNPQVPDVTAA